MIPTKFFLAGASPPFVPGNHCFLEESLRVHLQRNGARQCFRGKLFLYLRVEFDLDCHGILAPIPIIGWLRAKSIRV